MKTLKTIPTCNSLHDVEVIIQGRRYPLCLIKEVKEDVTSAASTECVCQSISIYCTIVHSVVKYSVYCFPTILCVIPTWGLNHDTGCPIALKF